jgi:hypothetical protein
MQVQGKIKKIEETKTYGESGFRKREMVLETDDKYPQLLKIEFLQDKCDLLNHYKANESVKISINLSGRKWINKEGKEVIFNSIQGWKIENLDAGEKAKIPSKPQPVSTEMQDDIDLPF